MLQYIVPQRLLTRVCKFLANCKIPFVKRQFINLFLRIYPVNIDEVLDNNRENYSSLNQFFIRRIKPRVRPIAPGKNAIVSPVDGTLYQFGKIDQNEKFNAKGFDFTLTELLAGKVELTKLFNEGDFCSLYLSPENYHRIHMPFAGTLQEMIYVPGQLFSVAPKVVETIPKIFSRNERIICTFETVCGPMIVILVGAIIVGSIHTVWTGSVNSNHSRDIIVTDYRSENIVLEKGEELGYFEIGSTVITLFPKGRVTWIKSIATDLQKLYGEEIGVVSKQKLE